MTTYQVVLTKSYAVTVKAGTEQQARHVAEFYTGDITDISNMRDRKKYQFAIEEIDCKMHEGLEVQKV